MEARELARKIVIILWIILVYSVYFVSNRDAFIGFIKVLVKSMW